MQGDDELVFLHYYLQKGFGLEELLRLSGFEKLFYKASMKAETEIKKEVSDKWRQVAEQMKY